MAALDIDGYLSNVKTLIAGTSIWQSLTGTANATDAAEFIHKGGYNESDGIVPPVCILRVNPWSARWRGNHFHADSIPVSLWFELPCPPANQTSYEAEYIWATQQMAALMAAVNGGVQGGGQLMATAVSMELEPGRVDEDENNGRCDWRFVFNLSGDVR